jgi:signal peptidase I
MPKPLRRFVIALLVGTGILVTTGGAWAAVTRPKMYHIPSGAMAPTLEVGDRVVAVRGDVRRGSVVVFTGWSPDPEKLFVKRVIGLPGDVVESRDGVVYVNGAELDEPYLVPGRRTDGLDRQTVPAGHYFVLGDHRDRSSDSRFHGPVPEDAVVRVVKWVVLPPGHAGRVR